MPLGANSFFGSVVNQMQRTVKAVGFTIEWVLTAVSDCGTMSVVVDVSEFPDCSTIFIWTIWTTIEWVLTTPASCAILAVQRSTAGFRPGNCSPSR